METIRVETRRRVEGTDLEADLKTARWLARLLDAQFQLGPVKLGLDAIVGLLPGIGDVAMLLAGTYPLHVVRKHGLGRDIERRMMLNLGIDFGLGLLPIVGDLVDLAYKANLKNLKLLEKAVERRNRPG